MLEALAECKQATRELHEVVKDAHQLKKDLEKLLTNDAESLMLHLLHTLLPQAINGAEEKAADELLKLNKIVDKAIMKLIKNAAARLNERDNQLKDLAESTIRLHRIMEDALEMEIDDKSD